MARSQRHVFLAAHPAAQDRFAGGQARTPFVDGQIEDVFPAHDVEFPKARTP